MARGFVYLVAVAGWFTRRVLSHRLPVTMEACFCIEALEEALAKYGKPEIFNTGQGLQFTSEAFTGVLIKNSIAISHRIAERDPFGSLWTARVPILDQTWRGNVFVERLWRSVKYEEVSLRAYESAAGARGPAGRYLEFYNRRRPHSSLDRRPPDAACFDPAPQKAAA